VSEFLATIVALLVLGAFCVFSRGLDARRRTRRRLRHRAEDSAAHEARIDAAREAAKPRLSGGLPGVEASWQLEAAYPPILPPVRRPDTSPTLREIGEQLADEAKVDDGHDGDWTVRLP
jgi:hypothetical protein